MCARVQLWDLVTLWPGGPQLASVSSLDPSFELSPYSLGSNQPKAPAGTLIATALPGHALPKLITFFCLFLLLSLINHSPVLGPGERGLRERHQPQLPWAKAGLSR